MKFFKFSLLLILLAFYCAAYEIILYSDVHYDGTEYRGENISVQQQRALKRNLASWEKELPELLRAGNERCKEGVEFAVVLGDLIHGYFASPSLHAQGLEKILEILQTTLSSCPVYIVKGNHDVVGLHGRDAFQASARPYMHKSFKQPGIGVGAANYTLTKENDLFIFFDCMEADLKFVEKTLKSAPEARHVFFFTHYPLIPSLASGGVSIVFADKDKERQKLLELLAERKAMVFCGHIHRTTFSRYRSEEGEITQLSIFSLLPPKSPDFAIVTEGDGEAFFSLPKVVAAIEEQKANGKILQEFQDKIVQYGDYGQAAGFTVLEINDEVKANLHYKGAKEASKVFKMK